MGSGTLCIILHKLAAGIWEYSVYQEGFIIVVVVVGGELWMDEHFLMRTMNAYYVSAW